jgi:hypothetical protein
MNPYTPEFSVSFLVLAFSHDLNKIMAVSFVY